MLTPVSTALGATYQHGSVPRCIPLTCRRLQLPEGEAKVNLARRPRARARLRMCAPSPVTAQERELKGQPGPGNVTEISPKEPSTWRAENK